MIAPRRVLVLGDTHGQVEHIPFFIKVAQVEKCDMILQLGDFAAFGRGRANFIEVLDVALNGADLDLWWIDGNHEDHPFILNLPVDPLTGLQPEGKYQRIHHIPRCHRWTWHGVKFLGLGGASSIDKIRRTEGKNWFPEETITYGQAIRAAKPGQVDVIISHDVPWGVVNPYGPMDKLGRLFPDSDANRKLLRQVVDETKPFLVLHGHTHWRKTTDLKLSDGKTTVKVEGIAHSDAFTTQKPQRCYEVLNIVDSPIIYVDNVSRDETPRSSPDRSPEAPLSDAGRGLGPSGSPTTPSSEPVAPLE